MGEKKGFLMKVVVIGGGPAGMMAAITASKNGNEVYLLEKNDRLGKKLLITGKGRCNITSSLDIKDFIQNVPGNGRFLYSSFDNYTNLDIINFLKKHGVSVKEERGNRIFPTSDKSLDVLKAFETELKNKRVKIKFNTRVVGIETKENKVVSVMYEDGNGGQKKILADKVILATGGKTYSATGSTDRRRCCRRCGLRLHGPRHLSHRKGQLQPDADHHGHPWLQQRLHRHRRGRAGGDRL